MEITIKRFGVTLMATLFVLMLAVPAVSLSGRAASPYEQQILQARYDFVSTRVNFAVGVLTDTATLVANASDLAGYADELDADLATLEGLVGANDRNGFDSYVSGTIRPDMEAAMAALKADLMQFRAWGVPQETIRELRSDYQDRRATYEEEMDAAVLELGDLRLGYYNDVMARSDERMANMSAKGVDVAGMQAVKAGASDSVVMPLQAALGSGDADAVRAQLHDKCLGNGQPYSYHYFARMDLEALKAVSAKVDSCTENETIKAQLADVNGELAATEAALSAVGTRPYTADQQTGIWDGLKAAAEGLKEILRGMAHG